jgi:hypothetical protein
MAENTCFKLNQDKLSQVANLRMPNKWHIFKESQAGNKNRQSRGLLVFSKQPSIPSAGSREFSS